jgi:hypothetical protein
MEVLLVIVMAVLAAGAVLYPVLRGKAASLAARDERSGSSAPFERSRPRLVPMDEAKLESEVARYRVALRGGTACRRCFTANPAGSRYCAECGRRLQAAGGV